MNKQINWFNREFRFESTQNIFPSIIERLWGTPVRLAARIHSIPPDILEIQFENTWSIKENIGHLTDLEPLWQGRLQDILSGEKVLRATDLQNRKTTEANHNSKPVDMLIEEFATIRGETLRMLEPLTEEDIFRTALHPRLQTPMRTMDNFLFVAEHDDHHLARITELSRILSR
ncbi:MAG TPA: DinB family protein [Flavitalea sp.]|nr:DinB family protein [Flavitalea sp.]